MLSDPDPAARDAADVLELARLERLRAAAVPCPPPELPGWQSLDRASEYEAAVRRLADLLGTVAAALAAARGRCP